MTLPSPLRAAQARVHTREDVRRAAADPGEPVALRATEGRSRASLYQRASEYRRGLLPYGLAMPADFIADAYADPNADVLVLVLQPGAPVPAPGDADRRAEALLRAYYEGEAQWPGDMTRRKYWQMTNSRLRNAGLRIHEDGVIRRIRKEHHR